jgi:hypothetical protein
VDELGMVGVGLAGRIVVSLTFGAAAVGKARNFRSFVGTLRDLGTPSLLTRPVATIIVGYEAILAILFATDASRAVATLLAILILLAFVVGSIAAIRSDRVIACNCFGANDSRLGIPTISRSVLLTVPVAAYFGSPYSGPWNLLVISLAISVAFGIVLIGRWLLALPQVVRLIVGRVESKRMPILKRQRRLSPE